MEEQKEEPEEIPEDYAQLEQEQAEEDTQAPQQGQQQEEPAPAPANAPSEPEELRYGLELIGIEEPRQTQIIEEGLTTYKDLEMLTNNNIKSMVDSLLKRTKKDGKVIVKIGEVKKL